MCKLGQMGRHPLVIHVPEKFRTKEICRRSLEYNVENFLILDGDVVTPIILEGIKGKLPPHLTDASTELLFENFSSQVSK